MIFQNISRILTQEVEFYYRNVRFLKEGVLIVDKVTCIAFLLYQSSKSQNIREKAIQLLNGDVTIRDLKKNAAIQAHVLLAESTLKKRAIDKLQVQQFAEEFLLLEV
jgi:hypothetical protein